MEEKIVEILLDVHSDMKEVKTGIKDLKTGINEIQETVKRIETSQSEDVVGLLKLTKKKTDLEVDYLNNRVTEMDKRIFNLEQQIEN